MQSVRDKLFQISKELDILRADYKRIPLPHPNAVPPTSPGVAAVPPMFISKFNELLEVGDGISLPEEDEILAEREAWQHYTDLSEAMSDVTLLFIIIKRNLWVFQTPPQKWEDFSDKFRSIIMGDD